MRSLGYFAQRYRVVIPDLRAHDRSAQVHWGHTVANYARDIYELVHKLGLTEVVMVGWSMGAFVTWDYFKQFGVENINATVIIDESASDFKWEDWPLGTFDFSALCGWMTAVQIDQAQAMRDFITAMFKEKPADDDARWMFDEATRMPESIASAILFDQSVQDYRPVLPTVNVPTLLYFGRDAKLYPVAAGEHLRQNLPQAQLVVFEQSGHCPFLEESDRFNREVDRFIQSLP